MFLLYFFSEKKSLTKYKKYSTISTIEKGR
nr:MAG TPA: hypothetical protein [Caudoviricetes sp.]